MSEDVTYESTILTNDMVLVCSWCGVWFEPPDPRYWEEGDMELPTCPSCGCSTWVEEVEFFDR